MQTPIWPTRITSDDDTVDAYLFNGEITPKKETVYDLYTAVEFLAIYSADTPDDPNAQAIANAIGFLIKHIERKEDRAALAIAKRRFAEINNVPLSKVRLKKGD